MPDSPILLHSCLLNVFSIMMPLQFSFNVAWMFSVIPFGTVKTIFESPLFTSITELPTCNFAIYRQLVCS